MRLALDEWTETSRYVDAVGVVHVTLAKIVGVNSSWMICPSLREPPRYEVTKDNPITCMFCLSHLGG